MLSPRARYCHPEILQWLVPYDNEVVLLSIYYLSMLCGERDYSEKNSKSGEVEGLQTASAENINL